jgi:hypothetical protein
MFGLSKMNTTFAVQFCNLQQTFFYEQDRN